MPVRVTAEEYAEKHARRLKASIQDIRSGVERVTESPTELAAAQQDKMLARLTEAVTSGKWARGLRAVSLADWKNKMLTKGVNNIAPGIDAAHNKVVDFARDLIAYENTLLLEIDRMSDLTIEDSIARATAWIRGMSRFVRA